MTESNEEASQDAGYCPLAEKFKRSTVYHAAQSNSFVSLSLVAYVLTERGSNDMPFVAFSETCVSISKRFFLHWKATMTE